MAKKMTELIGPIAFYIGLLIALVTAFIEPSRWLYVGLAVVGVVVSVLNITAEEVGPYLFASIAFIVSVLGMQQLIPAASGGNIPIELTRLAANITVLVGAGAMLIALKAIYAMAKSK